ncbi:MAG: ABC transporter ATP-binding protein [Chloroflexi bacterium]|nr:ABC transporter ATP-binding protein [Chloroflexota bacterium]
MILVEHLTKRFGAFTAVDDLSIAVADGEILALLGPNGAGKTTTIRMLTSILPPTSGRATINGLDTVADAQRVRRLVGLLTEVPGLYPRMNGPEYLRFFGRLQGTPEDVLARRIESLLRRFDLWDQRSRSIGTYSKGMRQKLALTRALIHDPKVIFLDEPTSAMDPASAKVVRDYIAELRRDDRIIVICTHNLAEAEALADRIAIIRAGRIIAHGSIEALRQTLLTRRQFELRFAGPAELTPAQLNGERRLVDVVDTGADWIRFTTADPMATNPQLVQRLVATGARVVSLSEVSGTLESVYLKIVESHGQTDRA